MNNNLNPKVKEQIDNLLDKIYSLNGPAPNEIPTAEIESLEQQYNLQLPASYKYLLSKIGEEGLVTIMGISDVKYYFKWRREVVFEDYDVEDEDIEVDDTYNGVGYIPILEDDCGNCACLDIMTGGKSFFDHETGDHEYSEIPENISEPSDRIDYLIIEFLKEELSIITPHSFYNSENQQTVYNNTNKTLSQIEKACDGEVESKIVIDVEEDLPKVTKQKISSKTFEVNGVSFEMMKVEGGTFVMGATPEMEVASDNAKPTHHVTLSSYYIGQTQVTRALWIAVINSNPSTTKRGKNPVERVSWYDCQVFIRKLNKLTGKEFRLPTEAEWEFAARGGNNSNHYQFSGSNNLDDVAWYDGNSGNKTHPVATKQANELGIYDMSGNVWEWCSDWYGNYSSNSQANPTGPNNGTRRVLRGCCSSGLARGCRSSIRSSRDPGYRNSGFGLRLCLSE